MSYIAKRFYSLIGKVSFDDVKAMNKNGATWVSAIDAVSKQQETEDPRIVKVRIKGAAAHMSHSDPSDPMEVITLQFLDENEARVKSMHIHEDGTSKSK